MLYNQCDRDSDCAAATADPGSPPPGPACCEDITEWAQSTCDAVDPAMLAGLMASESCRPRPDCVSQIMKGGGGGDSVCGPPRERCCTRVLSDPAATLRVDLREEAALSSVTLWLEGAAGGLLADDAQLGGADVSIGSADRVTGCELAGGKAGPGGAAAPADGFARFDLVCGPGAAGRYAALSFPRLAAGRGGTLAVRLCTVPAGGGAPPAQATLSVQTAPGYAPAYK